MTHSNTSKSLITALFAASLAFLALGISSCTSKEDDGNLMVFHGVAKDDVKSMDPANAYDVISLELVPNIYETLYQYAYLSEVFKIVPLLAADMPKLSPDRLTVTIPIKQGIRFQDDPCFKESGGKGRELKAQDFIYGWKRLALPSLNSQGWWIFDNKIEGINAYHDKMVSASKTDVMKIFGEEVSGMKALDDYTLQIKLTKPYPQLNYILAMSFTAPVPAEAVKAYGDENQNITDHPVGSGPYKLKSWDRGRRIVFERNSNYHPEFYPTEGSLDYRKKGLLADAGKQLPFIDKLVINIIKEAQPRWLNFMGNKIDVLEVPKDNFAQAITNQVNLSPALAAKGIRLSIDVGASFRYIEFNLKDKVFADNKYLPQALSAAIDRDKWIEIFTNGTARKMLTAIPPGIPDRPKTNKIKYDFNLAQAKELLKKAGYPEGKGLPTLNFELRGADSVNRQIGDFFQQQWAAIGVKTNVIANTFPAYLEKAKQGALQVSYGGWVLDYPDAENIYQLIYGPNRPPGQNGSNYDNPEFNKLYEETATMDSGPARQAKLTRMDEIMQEDCPWALGYHEATYYLTQPWLLNYRVSDIILNKHKYLRVNREVKKRYQETK